MAWEAMGFSREAFLWMRDCKARGVGRYLHTAVCLGETRKRKTR